MVVAASCICPERFGGYLRGLPQFTDTDGGLLQDPLIAQYTARVLPNVQQMLNTTKQRLNILPSPPIEATRAISDIQDILNRKPM